MEPDFNAVQAQLVHLAQTALRIPFPDHAYSASEAIELAIRPIEEELSEPHAALEFAAREVGAAMIALAGFNSLHRMFDQIEEHVGEREAMWICRSWVGLQSPDGRSTWSD